MGWVLGASSLLKGSFGTRFEIQLGPGLVDN